MTSGSDFLSHSLNTLQFGFLLDTLIVLCITSLQSKREILNKNSVLDEKLFKDSQKSEDTTSHIISFLSEEAIEENKLQKALSVFAAYKSSGLMLFNWVHKATGLLRLARNDGILGGNLFSSNDEGIPRPSPAYGRGYSKLSS